MAFVCRQIYSFNLYDRNGFDLQFIFERNFGWCCRCQNCCNINKNKIKLSVKARKAVKKILIKKKKK